LSQKIPFHFSDHLTVLNKIAIKSGVDEQAAYNFYTNGARNYFFKCEALCRIFRAAVDKKYFDNYYELFKNVEDQLGNFDYHEALFTEISSTIKSPETFLTYFKNNRDDSYKSLQSFLKKEKWLAQKSSKYEEINSDLLSVEYPSQHALRSSLGKYIIKQLEKVTEEYANGKLDPENIESGIHEIRRKLRWVSIYAQVCDGWIQLKPVNLHLEELSVYLTDEIIKSPFNVLPPATKDIAPLHIETNHFYALSWIIAELGKLKDEGMKILAIESAIKTLEIKDKEQIKNIRTIFNASSKQLESIPGKAALLLNDFFNKHKITQGIIRDINNSL
jgi:hypothetical protein